MPQLDKFTYFTQFFWSCLFLFTFYIPICKKDILRKGFSIGLSYIYSFLFTFYIPISIGLSYMYSSLFEVAQWCNGFLRKCIVFYVVSRHLLALAATLFSFLVSYDPSLEELIRLSVGPGGADAPPAPARELLPDLNEVPPQAAALEALLRQIEETQSDLKSAKEELKCWEEEGRAFFEKEARLYHEAQKSAELQRECDALLSKRDRQEAELAALREQLAKRRG
jgi:hypothetical protein